MRRQNQAIEVLTRAMEKFSSSEILNKIVKEVEDELAIIDAPLKRQKLQISEAGVEFDGQLQPSIHQFSTNA